ncbi:hypothetical protein Cal6303_3160 [Calothrix sp. PCC 6303]|nr:hypothetical protein Cal6303_3160 [Calothrix sp. PCC 6303]
MLTNVTFCFIFVKKLKNPLPTGHCGLGILPEKTGRNPCSAKAWVFDSPVSTDSFVTKLSGGKTPA